MTVVEAHFALGPGDQDALPQGFKNCVYVFGRKLDNAAWHRLDGAPEVATYSDLMKDLVRLCAHIDPRIPRADEAASEPEKLSAQLAAITQGWSDTTRVEDTRAKALSTWLNLMLPHIDEANTTEEKRYDRLVEAVGIAAKRTAALKTLSERLPVFVLFNNYFRVRPLIHLDHLAQRIETKILDDAQYDYGNQCLLKLLGFSARELSNLGKAPEPRR